MAFGIIIVGQFNGRERRSRQRVVQAQFGEFPHCVWQQVDADAQCLGCEYGLEYAEFDTDLVNAQRRCQPGDSSAGDQDCCHVRTLVLVNRCKHDQRDRLGYLRT